MWHASLTLSSGGAGSIVPEVVLALGSNLGDRRANLVRAVELLEEQGIHARARSSIWETAPVPAGQPPFLNAVITAGTVLEPVALLAAAKAIERALGRTAGRRWGPRPIDIDILFFGARRIASAELTVPHPRVAERDFVLVPLAEVLDGPLPVLGETARTLLERLPASSALLYGALKPV
jgi:2-amino-4-hydroxy-6-hydroxymethyldihydropteridine diphosphokinase